MKHGKFLGGSMTADAFIPSYGHVEELPEAERRRDEASQLWRQTFLGSREIGWFERMQEADKLLIAFWNAFGIGELDAYDVARKRLGWDKEQTDKDVDSRGRSNAA